MEINKIMTGKGLPIVAKVTRIHWDVPTSISITLPHEKTYALDRNFLKEKDVFTIRTPNCPWGEEGFNEQKFGEILMHKLIGEYGYAIKQIQYEVIDCGDYPAPY